MGEVGYNGEVPLGEKPKGDNKEKPVAERSYPFIIDNPRKRYLFEMGVLATVDIIKDHAYGADEKNKKMHFNRREAALAALGEAQQVRSIDELKALANELRLEMIGTAESWSMLSQDEIVQKSKEIVAHSAQFTGSGRDPEHLNELADEQMLHAEFNVLKQNAEMLKTQNPLPPGEKREAPSKRVLRGAAQKVKSLGRRR